MRICGKKTAWNIKAIYLNSGVAGEESVDCVRRSRLCFRTKRHWKYLLLSKVRRSCVQILLYLRKSSFIFFGFESNTKLLWKTWSSISIIFEDCEIFIENRYRRVTQYISEDLCNVQKRTNENNNITVFVIGKKILFREEFYHRYFLGEILVWIFFLKSNPLYIGNITRCNFEVVYKRQLLSSWQGLTRTKSIKIDSIHKTSFWNFSIVFNNWDSRSTRIIKKAIDRVKQESSLKYVQVTHLQFHLFFPVLDNSKLLLRIWHWTKV